VSGGSWQRGRDGEVWESIDRPVHSITGEKKKGSPVQRSIQGQGVRGGEEEGRKKKRVLKKSERDQSARGGEHEKIDRRKRRTCMVANRPAPRKGKEAQEKA